MNLFISFFLFCYPLLAFSGPTPQAYFSPEDAIDQKLIARIDEEKAQVLVAVYSFTHQGIAKALMDAKGRGVDVQVIVDRFSVKKETPLRKMVEAGIPVYVWDPEPKRMAKGPRSLMHHKFCVFGNEAVWSGSFNFTYDASRRHCENVVVLEDGVMADAFKRQFTTVRLRSCLPYASYVALKPPAKKKKVA